MNLCPSRLKPIFSPRPWGARSLAPFFPEKSGLAEPIGEAWLTGNDCVFENGPFAGEKLGAAWPKMPVEWAGTQIERSSDFPLLVKFIFPEEKLSVQVHPPDEYAARHEQASWGRGKTEMWYAVRAQPGAEVLVGLRPGATRERFKRAIAEGTAEKFLRHIPLSAGDAVFVPAGTLHTIGPGLVLCEIQQQSDLTYRVYDYNRKDAEGRRRPLHIEKAMEVINFGEQPEAKITPARKERGPVSETYLAVCRYFATERWDFAQTIDALSSPEHFEVLIFLEGTGDLRWGNEIAKYASPEVWLIPAQLGAYQIAPAREGSGVAARISLLRTYVPGDLEEFSRKLVGRGIPPSDCLNIVRH